MRTVVIAIALINQYSAIFISFLIFFNSLKSFIRNRYLNGGLYADDVWNDLSFCVYVPSRAPVFVSAYLLICLM